MRFDCHIYSRSSFDITGIKGKQKGVVYQPGDLLDQQAG
jgi:hypothetical protein